MLDKIDIRKTEALKYKEIANQYKHLYNIESTYRDKLFLPKIKI
jgi:hypothetical protein